MRVNGTQLNSIQSNFLKDLMGDPFMTDTRAEVTLGKVCAKHDIDVEALLEATNKRFLVKNAEFKKREAEERSRA